MQGRLLPASLALVRPREPDRADSDHQPRPGPLIGELWSMRQAGTAGAFRAAAEAKAQGLFEDVGAPQPTAEQRERSFRT
jgi:hypothetical protein